MTELIENKLYCVEVPIKTKLIRKIGCSGNFLSIFTHETGRKNINIPFDFILLGEVTKDEISFDVEPYVESYFTQFTIKNKLLFKDYLEEKINSYLESKSESFRSLLQSKGIYFENPIKEPESRGVSPNYILGPTDEEALSYDEWEEYEKNKIKGKLIVLEKIENI